jgi:hypothetical protein
MAETEILLKQHKHCRRLRYADAAALHGWHGPCRADQSHPGASGCMDAAGMADALQVAAGPMDGSCGDRNAS